jgi:hypothetical protein
LGRIGGVENVEAGPVDRGGGRGKRVVHVPEEGGAVGGGGDPVALGVDQKNEGLEDLDVGFLLRDAGGEVGVVGVMLRGCLAVRIVFIGRGGLRAGAGGLTMEEDFLGRGFASIP